MSKYAEEMVKNYGTVGILKSLTTSQKAQEKFSKELKQASKNITKILTKKTKFRRR